jgi:hypothetical protein
MGRKARGERREAGGYCCSTPANRASAGQWRGWGAASVGADERGVGTGDRETGSERRGREIAGEYVDVGISGAREKRPQLDRLLAECRKRLADAVVVYRYDRFARSLRQLVKALCEFDALGIQCLASLQASLNLSGN